MHTARLVVMKTDSKTLTEITGSHMHTARLVVVKQT